MADKPSQAELWSHFQTQRSEVFTQARSRHYSLIRLAERLSSGRSLLNIGCGNAFLERVALARGWKVLSVDPDRRSVELVKSTGVEARCGTIESLPVASESLHVVMCTEVFEHLTPHSLVEGLKEIRRALMPGGILIGTVPYRENLLDNEVFCPHCHQIFHRWGHHQSFDQAKIRSVLGEYFSVVSVRASYFPDWQALNWRGKLLASVQCALSLLGVYGASAKLVFAASKT